ncbi:hypothetical protein Tsubulata_045794 [Turnera subulata]|uniref:RING-type E3 ubiquitin transferase n=1 Tax=Turnera subulata TaxID=218843 RepID=A0A9Q0J442_9ROSI|nr:hypothetical protein Tsubulata_045794 [Turnera subulata]
MASESDQVPELSAFFERLLRQRDNLSLFLPFFLGFAGNNNNNQEEDPDQETPQTRERIILINPFTQGMVVIDGVGSLESLFEEIGRKSGQPPASKASIEAMPSVEIGEEEDKEGECAICLEDWEVGVVAKEMPCKHRFHPGCVEKWLRIHGNCPVCRYAMPVEEDDPGKKRSSGEGEETEEGENRRRRVVGREIWVSFAFNGGGGGGRRNGDSDQTPAASSNDDSSSSPRPEDPDHELDA